jgi:DNA repair exonuclease SbcCD ATPase subunit
VRGYDQQQGVYFVQRLGSAFHTDPINAEKVKVVDLSVERESAFEVVRATVNADSEGMPTVIKRDKETREETRVLVSSLCRELDEDGLRAQHGRVVNWMTVRIQTRTSLVVGEDDEEMAEEEEFETGTASITEHGKLIVRDGAGKVHTGLYKRADRPFYNGKLMDTKTNYVGEVTGILYKDRRLVVEATLPLSALCATIEEACESSDNRKKLRSAQKDLTEALEQKREAYDAEDEAVEKKEDAEREKADVEAKLSSANAEIEELKGTHTELDLALQKIAGLRNDVIRLEAADGATKRQLAEAQRELEKLKEANTELENKMAKEEDAWRAAQSVANAYVQKKLQETQQDLNTAVAEVQKLKNDKAAADEKLAAADEKLAAAEKKLAAAEEKLAAADEEEEEEEEEEAEEEEEEKDQRVGSKRGRGGAAPVRKSSRARVQRQMHDA